jgi:ABC-type phosphate transport system substrate-binding protein
MTLRNISYALLGAAALLAGSGRASAQIACYDNNGKAVAAPGTKEIYLAGSSALGPLLQTLAPSAANPKSGQGYTFIYYNPGSCGGVQNIHDTNNTTPAGNVKTTYFPADGSKPVSCTPKTVSSMTPVAAPVDVVLSDVDPNICPAFMYTGKDMNGNQFIDTTGPVNGMVFAVPSNSHAAAISAEEAYLVYGFADGDNNPVMPWTNHSNVFYRKNDSGTRAMVNVNIGMLDQGGLGPVSGTRKPNAWQGTLADGTTPMVTAVSGANMMSQTVADQTIGILGINDWIANKTASLKPLAFRAFHQKLAYYPGSTQSSLDMINVRYGRYKIWGYVHMLTPQANQTQAATDFIKMVNDPGAIDGIIASHLTPVCAMHVKHDREGHDQQPFTPAQPCDCYFVAKATGTAPSSCKTCSSDTDCGGGHCDLHNGTGYCQ